MSDVREFAPMPASVRKLLSEYIRLSSMLRPQAFLRAYDDKGGACAVMGALEAAGTDWTRASDTFPELVAVASFRCPACAGREVIAPIFMGPGALAELLIHLNDRHLWSRELIAQHVETLEQENVSGIFSAGFSAAIVEAER